MTEVHSVRQSACIFKEDAEENERESKIATMFEDATIFLTGGTGFLGKLYLEKLLRSCPKLKKIYLLARPKKGKDVETRLQEIFDSPCMVPLKLQNPKFMDKLAVIYGECSLPDMGVDEDGKKTIIQETNFIIHCAATVRFDEKIQTAAYINIRGVRDLLSMAKRMKGLKAFLHLSTAYSYCPRKEIDEKFYDPVMLPEQLLDLVETLDEERLTNITPGLLGDWPNTYAFTKALAEHLVKREVNNLPIAVLRPSIVISANEDPVRGWIDNYYGPVGVTVWSTLGVIRTIQGDERNRSDLIPCDVVVNAGIAVLWETAKTWADNQNQAGIKRLEEPIYNIVSSVESPITWRNYWEYNYKHAVKILTVLAIWHHYFRMCKKRYQYEVARLLLHTIPAHLVDFICFCLGKERMMVKGYQKIEKLTAVITYFVLREWNFSNYNVQKLWDRMEPEDQKQFHFSMKNFDWDTYYYYYVRGARVYLLKDPLETVPKGRVKYWKLFFAHYSLMALFLFLLVKLVCLLWSCIF